MIASRQRQRDNVIEPQGPEKIRTKNFGSRCLDGVATPNTRYSNIAITNNYMACKQGYVVAPVLSLAQL